MSHKDLCEMGTEDISMATKGIALINKSWDQKSGHSPATKIFQLTHLPKIVREGKNYKVGYGFCSN